MGPISTVAEKARHTGRSELVLHAFGVVIGPAKEALAAAVATAEAGAINLRAAQFFRGATEQLVHILHGGGGRAALELHGLAGAGKRAHRDAPGNADRP